MLAKSSRWEYSTSYVPNFGSSDLRMFRSSEHRIPNINIRSHATIRGVRGRILEASKNLLCTVLVSVEAFKSKIVHPRLVQKPASCELRKFRASDFKCRDPVTSQSSEARSCILSSAQIIPRRVKINIFQLPESYKIWHTSPMHTACLGTTKSENLLFCQISGLFCGFSPQILDQKSMALNPAEIH